MPLTPTEQYRQKERDRNSSIAKNNQSSYGSMSQNQYQMNQVNKRPRDNSVGPPADNSMNQGRYNQPNSVSNGTLSMQPQNQNNTQKMKMIYKKQINSHRATSQTTAINGGAAAQREAQNLQTQRAGPN